MADVVRGTVATSGGSGTSATIGAAVPATATPIGVKDNSNNLAYPSLDASGNLKVSGSLTTSPPASDTATRTDVADAATNQTLLAANANRLAFKIYNDSDVDLFIKCGATATTTDFTERIFPQQTWGTAQLGVNYRGRVDGIWASNSTGSARITEFTA